jgi:two-component system response regulator YesN
MDVGLLEILGVCEMKERKVKRFMKSSLFEYFNYFLVLSLLVGAITGGALYYSSSSLLWKDAIQNSSNTLQLLKNGQEIVLAEVDKAMEAVFLDSSFLHYMNYYEQSDIYMQLQLRQRLENVVLSSGYIHSVSIYYTSSHLVLSSLQGAVPLSGFQDKDFIHSMVGQKLDKAPVRTRSLPGISAAKEETVISIVKTLPIIHSGTPSAYVVINIKGNYLGQIMQSLNTNPDAQLIVTDSEGHILSQKALEEELSASGGLFSDLDFSQISGTAGSLFTKVRGNDSLVCYVTSVTSGWVYIYTIPKSVVTHSLDLWSQMTILICLMAVGLSLIGSLLLSKRIFNPMNRLLVMLRGTEKEVHDRGTEQHAKEIVQIERNVSRLIDQNRDLTVLLKDYEILSRNKFLLRLVSGDEQMTPQALKRLDYYGLSLPEHGAFIVVLVSMDEYARFAQETHEAERNAFLLQLSERLQDEAFVKQRYKGYLVEAEPNEMVLVLCLGQGDMEADKLPEGLRHWLRQLLELLQRSSMLTFTIGVSSLHTTIEELTDCYLEAGSALRQKLVYGGNTVIFYEAVRPEAGISMYPLGLEKQLLTHFKTGNREGIASALREFEEHMVGHHARQIEVVRHYFLQLFSSSLRCVYEIDANLGFQPVIQRLRHTDMLEMETMQSMVGYMQALYDLVLDQLEQKRSLKNREMAASVSAYIEAHLADDLSNERLSEIFAISTSHLRKIYKDETGMTIKERVSERRLAAAKELLGDPRLKIQDISDQVGYLTVQSFIKAFKMETGKTPGEYRAELLRANG